LFLISCNTCDDEKLNKDYFFEIYCNAKEKKRVERTVYILEEFFQLAKESLKLNV
jgi:hypothetical protein